jgi:heme-degrading monooxygenase HmoA
MATISLDDDHFTVVNVFKVAGEEDQRRLFDHIVEVTGVISKFPGFVSANLHLTFDGTRVVNYAQWRSREDFEAMHASPELQDHFAFCRSIVTGIERVHAKLAYCA